MHSAFVLHDIRLCRAENPHIGNALLIEEGRVARIAPERDLACLGVPKVSGGGAYVLPGFIDCHSHLSLDCALDDYLQVMNHEAAELAIIATKTLERDLKSGVTLKRCLGDRFFIDCLCRGMVESGYLRGPRLKISGIGMRASHGHGFVGQPVDGEHALIATIRENLKRGVDWIKFYATGTSLDGGVARSFYSKREISCIIDEAHRAGIPVTSHCIGGQAMLDSIELGIDCIEHAYYADAPQIEAVLRAGIPVCLTPSEYFTDKPTAPAASQALFKAARRLVQKSMEAVISAGVPFVLGTDGMHGLLWQEACYAASFGAKTDAVLDALSTNAAKLLGVSNERGRVEEGYFADLVLLEKNPYDSIENLQYVRSVYKDGELQ